MALSSDRSFSRIVKCWKSCACVKKKGLRLETGSFISWTLGLLFMPGYSLFY